MKDDPALLRMAAQHQAIVMDTRMYYPDGNVLSYVRLIDGGFLRKEMTFDMFKFYTDDLGYSLWKAIEEKRDG